MSEKLIVLWDMPSSEKKHHMLENKHWQHNQCHIFTQTAFEAQKKK